MVPDPYHPIVQIKKGEDFVVEQAIRYYQLFAIANRARDLDDEKELELDRKFRLALWSNYLINNVFLRAVEKKDVLELDFIAAALAADEVDKNNSFNTIDVAYDVHNARRALVKYFDDVAARETFERL